MRDDSIPARRGRAALFGLAATLIALAVCWPASAVRASSATVNVWFLQGEQMAAVKRPGATGEDAIRQLLAGPTSVELQQGYRTYVPAGTVLRSVTVENGVAVVNLSVGFVSGRGAQSLLARLAQVVYTATGPEGAKKVRLLIEGGTPLGIFPGVFTEGPISIAYLKTPNVPIPKVPAEKASPVQESVLQAQQHLVQDGYLQPGTVDGQLGPVTQTAVLAFQKWEGLTPDGVLGPATTARLRTATRPRPITQGPAGRRAEVLLDRQVALAIQDNRVVRVIHVSTGKPSTPTPPGSYRVYAKYAKWWSVPFREWLLWALPFTGGIAFHEFPEVPAYPASHGCVRQSYTTAHWLFDFARVGMPVRVIARSR